MENTRVRPTTEQLLMLRHIVPFYRVDGDEYTVVQWKRGDEGFEQFWFKWSAVNHEWVLIDNELVPQQVVEVYDYKQTQRHCACVC